MSSYTPDRWVILELTSSGASHRRVLGGWHGGFAGADRWRLNSGIVHTRLNDGLYEFEGDSGSTYFCRKELYGFNSLMASVLPAMRERNPGIDIRELTLEEILLN